MGIFLLGYAVYAAYCSKLPLPVQAGFCKSFVLLPISFLYICTLDNWSTQRIDAQHLFLALLCAEQAVLHIGDIFLHFPISLSPQLCVFPLLLYLGLSKVPVVHKSSRLVNHLKYKDMHSKLPCNNVRNVSCFTYIRIFMLYNKLFYLTLARKNNNRKHRNVHFQELL